MFPHILKQVYPQVTRAFTSSLYLVCPINDVLRGGKCCPAAAAASDDDHLHVHRPGTRDGQADHPVENAHGQLRCAAPPTPEWAAAVAVRDHGLCNNHGLSFIILALITPGCGQIRRRRRRRQRTHRGGTSKGPRAGTSREGQLGRSSRRREPHPELRPRIPRPRRAAAERNRFHQLRELPVATV